MLEINTEKTKCVTFQKKNKKNTTNSFYLGNKQLKNVVEFKYLGFLINASGSFMPSVENLSIKANKAIYSLNDLVKIKSLSPKDLCT